MYPYNRKMGQTIQADADSVAVDMGFIAHYQIAAADAVATSDTAVHAAIALTTAAQDITTNITNPAVPRALRIKGNQAGVAGNVVIAGTNYAGEAITETIAANGATAVDGNKAFKTITKITVPVKVADGDSISVGFNDKLGLPFKLAHNTVLKTFVDNALEGTAPTVTTDVANIENNTLDTNTALSGKVVDIYLIA